ncbi:MAG: acyl-CoA dehydrogenase [Gammaproteobacteria bacterium]|uniref:acyl-CoA dehydrogenase family protein n=1 Tax=Pseudomaricurvus alcaniphilus TaxID=1166482 RepID=UPI00140A8CF2|nr:acyl-CoA dehydrogenase family protein [Pseudomaricurvus alcaniphilus]MBR9911103.1 acyl-CoA dehydrogenase [Gammaproteobacteria bacterium]NHN36393.1 acyl-CoA dehydrogenase [Pseudomaricurvus alcaniphilus]
MSTLEQFRQQTRAWLEANCPDSQRQPIVKEEQIWGGRRRTFPSADAKLWFERMRDRGWTAPEWPSEYGGGGLNPEQAQILQEEMQALGCRPPLYEIGLWMFGPALLKFGTEAQKAEHIPKIVRGEIRWSQGYSEPAAGSDLAGLKTRAEDKGDHFLVNGTKIWTTQADKADWIFCLVRTDPNAPKQEGISFLLIDMETRGVSTSPIQLISGESEFCQTFFDDVVVPKENLVGEFNQGWTVAKELLKHERKLMSIMGAMAEREEEDLRHLAKRYIGVDEQGKIRDPILRDRVTRHLMQSGADALTNKRLYQLLEQGQAEPNLPLIMKYVSTTEVQRKDELLLAILGNRGLSWHDDEFSDGEKRTVQNWAYNKAHTIAGGTSEIQLNIIAKRVLQLPG